MRHITNFSSRTIFFLVSLFFFSPLVSHCQTPVVDSLETVLAENRRTDTVRVNLLNKLAYELHRVDVNKAKEYANLSIKMAKELKYQQGEAESLWVTGLTFMKSDMNVSLNYFNQALAIAEQVNDLYGVCNYLLSIGVVSMNRGNVQESERIFEKALKIATELEDKTIYIKLLYNVSINLSRQGNYSEALTKLHKLIDIATEVEDNQMLIKGYSGLANIFRRQGHETQALEYFLSSLRISEKTGDKINIFENLINIAGITSSKGGYQDALKTINRADEIAKEIGDSIMISICLTNTGHIYKLMKNPDALSYLKQAHQILNGKNIGQNISLLIGIGAIYTEQGTFKEAQDNLREALSLAQQSEMKNMQCEVLISLGNLSYAQKRYAEAIEYGTEALQLSKQIGYKETQKDSYKLLSDIYDASGNYKFALSNRKSFEQLNDSLFNEKNVRKIALLESSYKYEKDKQRFELDQFNSQVKIRNQKYYIFGLVAVVALAFIFSYLIYISNKLKKKALRLEIDLANSELEYSRKKMTSATLKLVQNSERDDYCIKMLDKIATDSQEDREQNIRSLISYYKNRAVNSNWNEFEVLFLKVNSDFYDKLNERFPSLTLNERKLCVFLKLNMTSKDIAKITFQSEEALKKARLRLRKKMELDRGENLSSFMQSI